MLSLLIDLVHFYSDAKTFLINVENSCAALFCVETMIHFFSELFNKNSKEQHLFEP